MYLILFILVSQNANDSENNYFLLTKQNINNFVSTNRITGYIGNNKPTLESIFIEISGESTDFLSLIDDQIVFKKFKIKRFASKMLSLKNKMHAISRGSNRDFIFNLSSLFRFNISNES